MLLINMATQTNRRWHDRMPSMGIFLGLVAAIFWGAGDFLARYSTLRIGTYRTVFFIQFIGFIGLGAYLFVTGQLQHLLTSTTWEPWGWALLAGLLNVVSSLLLYRAFEVGTLTLVSPIAASYAAVTVILAFLSGEMVSSMHQLAIVIVFFGVVVAATPLSTLGSLSAFSWRSDTLRGVGLATAAALGYGATFWILGFHVTANLGGIVPVWLIRTMTPCLLLFCSPLVGQSLRWPRSRLVWWCLTGTGVFDTLAYVAYTTGMLQQGQIAEVTMLSSLYSAVTVLLARIFLRERIQQSQWFGVSIIFIGIVLVNF